jgi:hypothetical protein
MNLSAKIKIPSNKVNLLQKAINTANGSLPKDSVIWEGSCQFPNGWRAVFQVISPLEPAKEPCWVQCAIKDQNGRELACAGFSDSLLDKYKFYLGNNECTVKIVAE